ncbi:MAG TPA: hypothetical protein VIL74_00465 [Pyrinomonadaceae bacterium]|jgi:hypothetical protein
MRINTRKLNRASDIHASQNFPPPNVEVVRRSNLWIVGGVAFLILAVVLTIIILKIGRPKVDPKMIVIGDLRAINTAQQTFFAAGGRNAYGNFDELVRAGLLPPSEGSYFVCKDCDGKELWYGKNKDYMFQLARNAAGSGYCVAAVPRLDSDKAYAVGHAGIIFEDDKENITCAGGSRVWTDGKNPPPLTDTYIPTTPTKTVDFRTLPTVEPAR